MAERARRRAASAGSAGSAGSAASAASGSPDDLPPGPLPLLLAPEATAALVDLLNRLALSSAAFAENASVLSGRLGQQVFHPMVSLCDDGTDPRGLPFPFDLAGDARRPVDLIEDGVFLTPALDAALAERLGRTPTAHAVALDESLAIHLFFRPGPCDEGEVLRRTDGGLWVGSLAGLACFDRRELRFRALARGVRRIEAGALGRAVPDLVWEASLGGVFTQVLGAGREVVVVGGDEPLLGGISAPALAIGPTGSLQVAPGQ